MYSFAMLVALALYGLTTVFYMLYLAGLWTGARRWAQGLLLVSAVAHLGAIGHYHVNGLQPPVLSVPGMVNLGIFLVTCGLLVRIATGGGANSGAIVAPLAAVVLGTLVNNAGVARPAAHLEFVRFVTPVHIATSAVGFLCFGVAFLAAAGRVVQDHRLREHHGQGWPPLPAVATLDRVVALGVNAGFPFYTLGILLGVVWSYWGDPGGGLMPEYLLGVAVWAFFAVLVYLFRATGWRGRRAAVLVMIGFLATIPIVMMYALRRWTA